ncbi:CD56 [Mytilus edulis]|uniref:NCAM n=1 Tax=Mytilus edulis TaxID=6550 RepID=A0A8S3UQ97_MYTED|nr:CD56 [Mytilus edulis]
MTRSRLVWVNTCRPSSGYINTHVKLIVRKKVGTSNRVLLTLAPYDFYPPPSPSAQLKEVTPISITFDVNIPKTFNGPPVQEIEVQYSNAQPRKVRVGTMDSKIEIVLDGLTPGTAYNVKVYARNEVGLSPEYSLPTQTLQARKPYPIVVRSSPYGEYPLKFDLQWNTPNNGGYPISSVYVKYAQVEVFPNKSASGEFQKKQLLSGWIGPIKVDGAATAYQINSLRPSTHYEVEVTAVNNKGTSDAKSFIFVTGKVPDSGHVGSFAQFLLPSKLVLTMATVLWACLGILL